MNLYFDCSIEESQKTQSEQHQPIQVNIWRISGKIIKMASNSLLYQQSII